MHNTLPKIAPEIFFAQVVYLWAQALPSLPPFAYLPPDFSPMGASLEESYSESGSDSYSQSDSAEKKKLKQPKKKSSRRRRRKSPDRVIGAAMSVLLRLAFSPSSILAGSAD